MSLLKMDEIRGIQVKDAEPYQVYGEAVFMKYDKVARHF
jgi:hypothetical protein